MLAWRNVLGMRGRRRHVYSIESDVVSVHGR